ncbi:DUF1906 domain-containing protein [Streptomyces sp. G-G2]|uniref:DUF1906 domain-containing protein n=1 Tax=Streptomyces sp. G-G2 TaxID=3046201 RepID=UPI0024BB7AE4|nr:DUF1906 domain-containing protein [Streptomyces sp. G-G2]MDJ0379928.1 DUF1906 domain-containing protein [Streptomyces sp. G-G2]
MTRIRATALAALGLALALLGPAAAHARETPAGAGPDPAPGPASARGLTPRVLPDHGPPPRRPEVFRGEGFDACAAPSAAAMRAWWDHSPYGAVGIYTSGAQRHCAQPRLTADWVRRVQAMGWRLIPVHVGLQAPCTSYAHKPRRIDPARAVEQGRQEAGEALAGLRALGLGAGSPVYLDVEAYHSADLGCARAVVDFASGWTQRLHESGHRAGYYSSLGSGLADLADAARAGTSPLPDAVWYARWDQRADTADNGALSRGLWPGHRRIHQYRGNVRETYGGVTLTIDRDLLDAPVALHRP